MMHTDSEGGTDKSALQKMVNSDKFCLTYNSALQIIRTKEFVF